MKTPYFNSAAPKVGDIVYPYCQPQKAGRIIAIGQGTISIGKPGHANPVRTHIRSGTDGAAMFSHAGGRSRTQGAETSCRPGKDHGRMNKQPPEPAYWRVWWLAFCGLIMAGVAVFTAYLAAVHGGSMFGAMAFVASSLGSISHFARMITEIRRL